MDKKAYCNSPHCVLHWTPSGGLPYLERVVANMGQETNRVLRMFPGDESKFMRVSFSGEDLAYLTGNGNFEKSVSSNYFAILPNLLFLIFVASSSTC